MKVRSVINSLIWKAQVACTLQLEITARNMHDIQVKLSSQQGLNGRRFPAILHVCAFRSSFKVKIQIAYFVPNYFPEPVRVLLMRNLKLKQ